MATGKSPATIPTDIGPLNLEGNSVTRPVDSCGPCCERRRVFSTDLAIALSLKNDTICVATSANS